VLLQHDTPEHPDVRMLERTIRDLEAKQQAEAKDPKSGLDDTGKGLTPAQAIKEKRSRDLKAELSALDRELQDKRDREQRLHEQLTGYQAKLEAVPSRESDLVALTRDYTTLQTAYQNLLAKREDATLAANLEHRDIGEQFRVLDPARIPESPYSPKPLVITGAGAALGLVIGLAIIGFSEYRDNSFGTDDDVVRLCQVPVLAMVPVMMTEQERKAKRRRLLLLNVAAVLVVLAAGAVMITVL
jgi:uncharacterized protein involved in exopolysaccharide biosynthesis